MVSTRSTCGPSNDPPLIAQLETDEGLDKKFSLHYYSRMRFLVNLLPQLTAAGNAGDSSSAAKTGLGKNFSRVVSVLSAGDETPLIMNDLSLKHNFSLRNCARHAITMNSLSMEELAAAHPATSFVHAYPSAVKTGLLRGFGPITQAAIETLYFFTKPFFVSLDESGARHLYAATSSRFSPRGAKDVADAAPGSNGRRAAVRISCTGMGLTMGTKSPSKSFAGMMLARLCGCTLWMFLTRSVGRARISLYIGK